jgi:hypothetical protein
MWRRGLRTRNERGSTIALIAVCLFAMLALAALAIDLAVIRDARSEAQRVADATALAGASAFRDLPNADPNLVTEAGARALSYARRNRVRADTIDIRPASMDAAGVVTVPNAVITDNTYNGIPVRTIITNEVTLNIIPHPDSQKVRAWIRREGVQTFFGGMLAKPYAHVQAMATAWASNDGPTVNCLKPFLIPDMWHENNKATQDVNSNDYMEPEATANGNNPPAGEQWFYEPSTGDYYQRFDPEAPAGPNPQTGYGSGHLNPTLYPGDVGLPMLIKPQTGNNQRQGNSYFTLDGPEDNLRDDIKFGCINAGVGDNPNWSQGSATGQAKQGIKYLIDQDPGATWNPTTRQIENSAFADWTQSPRVIIIGLMDPIYIQGSSVNVKPDNGAVFNNFARMFLQDSPGNTNNIQAIFLGFAPGGTGGPEAGTLVKNLQLIE